MSVTRRAVLAMLAITLVVATPPLASAAKRRTSPHRSVHLMDMRSTITPNPIATPDSSVDAKFAPSLRAFDRQMISDAIEAVNTDFDLERLREIDRFLRNLPDSEATLDDVAQMLDAITAW